MQLNQMTVLEKLEHILADAVRKSQKSPNDHKREKAVEKARSSLAIFRVMKAVRDPVATAIHPSLLHLPPNAQSSIRKVTKVVITETANVITEIGTATALKDVRSGELNFTEEDVDAAEVQARLVVINAVKKKIEGNLDLKNYDEACNRAIDKLHDLGIVQFIFEAAYTGTRAITH